MLLAVDSATRFMSLAVHDGQQILAEQTLYSANHHSVQLSDLIAQMLQRLELSAHDLTGLAISQGPGSYSSLRVGFGVMKGLATARQLPMVPIPTMDVMAAATPRSKGALVTILPMGRGRIVAGWYRWSKTAWVAKGDPHITTWDELLAGIEKETTLTGEMDVRGALAETDKAIHVMDGAWRVRRAGFLAELAWSEFRAGHVYHDPAAVNPIYLKEPG